MSAPPPSDPGGQYGPQHGQQPGQYGQPAPEYGQQPGQYGQPAPQYGQPGAAAPSQAGRPTGSRLAASWTGALIALGGLLAAIGAFLKYEELKGQGTTYSFTGIGSETASGRFASVLKQGAEPGNAGKIVLVAGIITLVLGLLVLARRGKLWVGIVALVVALVGLLLALAALGAPSSDADDLGSGFQGSVGIGAILGVIGMLLAALGALLAIILRRRAV